MIFEIDNICKLNIEVLEGVVTPSNISKFFIKSLPLHEHEKNKKVLDVGTGSGIFALYLASKGYKYIVASDYFDAPLECAKINAKKNNFENAIDIRKSNAFLGLKAGEKFALVVTNPGGVYLKGRSNILMTYMAKNIDTIMDDGRVVFLQPKIANIDYIKKLFVEKGFEVKVLAKESFKLNPINDSEKEIERSNMVFEILEARRNNFMQSLA